MDLARVTLVLDKVRHPDNLGSTLRAMRNCGLSRLTLVDPQTRDFERAKVMATDAADLLHTLVEQPDLPAAVAHGTLVAGTTSRQPEGRRCLWLRDFARLAAEETARGGEVVVVFGNEQRGLSDAELDHCQWVVNIPTSSEKSSINLAQSVMLVGYELFTASFDVPAATPPEGEPANAGELNALYARMREALLDADFLNPHNPDAILSELKRLLERARPNRREAELLLNAFKHLQRAMHHGPRKRGPGAGN
ncbi:MAG: RNA methyltransferase [Myxococcales bacterium]